MHIDPQLYRRTLQADLRQGTPIEWSIEQKRPTILYIWHTRGGDKVRPSLTAKNGRIFAWDDPPETGHPGEDYGRRCTVAPFLRSVDKFIEIKVANAGDNGAS